MTIDLATLCSANREFLARRAAGEGLLINGAWRSAEGGRSFPTLDPATGAETGRIASASASDVGDAVAAAGAALAASEGASLSDIV